MGWETYRADLYLVRQTPTRVANGDWARTPTQATHDMMMMMTDIPYSTLVTIGEYMTIVSHETYVKYHNTGTGQVASQAPSLPLHELYPGPLAHGYTWVCPPSVGEEEEVYLVGEDEEEVLLMDGSISLLVGKLRREWDDRASATHIYVPQFYNDQTTPLEVRATLAGEQLTLTIPPGLKRRLHGLYNLSLIHI